MAIKKDLKKKPVVAKPVAKPVKKPVVAKPLAPVVAKEKKEKKDDGDDKKKAAGSLMLVRGMKDILPPQSGLWQRAQRIAQNLSDAYGFEYFATPIVEAASLFVRAVGRGTDVVDKEMYLLEDRDGGKLALRPEMTASVVRAYIMHGLQQLPQPVKIWNFGPLFRYDRPQAGRQRQFHQFDFETLGEKSPVIDAELIAVAYNFCRDLGLETVVRVNSLGTPADRENYLVELVGYLRTKRAYLCEDCKKRLVKNPMRVLDCKEEGCVNVLTEAPQIVDWLSEESKGYFMSVLEYLDELSIPYVLTPTLVRGLDYYTHTVFELYEENIVNETAQMALGGGGRYDLLVEQLGGQPTPAAGFALGAERLMLALERKPVGEVVAKTGNSVFFAQLGEQARRRALFLLEEMRRDGITVQHNLAKSSLKAQLELANKNGATHTLILGQKEVQDGTVLIRNMESGIQEIVDQKKIKTALRRILDNESAT